MKTFTESFEDVEDKEGDISQSVQFPYEILDGDSIPETQPQPSFGPILNWIGSGKDSRAKEIRLQAARCVTDGISQTQAALEIGCTKQAICQQFNAFRDYFGIKTGLSGVRDAETRQRFSEQCKIRHKQKKNTITQVDIANRLRSFSA